MGDEPSRDGRPPLLTLDYYTSTGDTIPPCTTATLGTLRGRGPLGRGREAAVQGGKVSPVGEGTLLFQEAVGEVDELFPVIEPFIVFAFADMLSHPPDNHRLLDSRNFPVSNAIIAEQFVH